MGVVDDADKRLDTASSGNLLLVHGLGNLEWGLFDTSNQGTTELLTGALITFIEV